MTRALKRIQKEKEKFDKDGIGEGLSLTVLSDLEWSVTFTMAGGSVFDGESFSLKIIFDEKRYPFDAPIVVFEQPSPEHEHGEQSQWHIAYFVPLSSSTECPC
jgi:ubiquitin-protein ligase